MASDGEQMLTELLAAQNEALIAEIARLSGQVAALREAGQRVIDCIDPPLFFSPEALRASLDVAALRLALAATGGEGQG